jgi:hypothetical protein
MTETTASPLDPVPDEPEAEGPQNRRRMLLFVGAGVVVAALVGYFVVFPLLQSPAKPVASTLTVAKPPVASSSPVPTAKPTVVPKSFTDVMGRDPFIPLVLPGGTGGGATPANPSATPSTGASPAPSTAAGKTTFTLISVTGSKSTVSVDAKKYTMSVGQVFAKSYRLLKTVSGACASFSYGAMRFSLCEGQTFIY